MTLQGLATACTNLNSVPCTTSSLPRPEAIRRALGITRASEGPIDITGSEARSLRDEICTKNILHEDIGITLDAVTEAIALPKATRCVKLESPYPWVKT